MTRCKYWVALLGLATVGFTLALPLLFVSCGERAIPPQPPISVRVDSSAIAIMDRLHGRRLTMRALVAKEKSPDTRLSTADKRKWDALDVLADSCSSLMSAGVTGLAGDNGVGPCRVVVFLWPSFETKDMVLFSAYINYVSRVGGTGRPSARGASADIADVGAQLAMELLRGYPRLEYVEIAENRRPYGTLARLKITRKALGVVPATRDGLLAAARAGSSGAGYDSNAGCAAFSITYYR